MDRLELRNQVDRHLAARAFVGFVHRVAERRLDAVECHEQIVRLLRLEQVQHVACEAVHGRHRFAPRAGHFRNRVKHLKDQRVGVARPRRSARRTRRAARKRSRPTGTRNRGRRFRSCRGSRQAPALAAPDRAGGASAGPFRETCLVAWSWPWSNEFARPSGETAALRRGIWGVTAQIPESSSCECQAAHFARAESASLPRAVSRLHAHPTTRRKFLQDPQAVGAGSSRDGTAWPRDCRAQIIEQNGPP